MPVAHGQVQAVLFPAHAWGTVEARGWLAAQGYKAVKRVHRTVGYLRYRMQSPEDNRRWQYFTEAAPGPGGVLLVRRFARHPW